MMSAVGRVGTGRLSVKGCDIEGLEMARSNADPGSWWPRGSE